VAGRDFAEGRDGVLSVPIGIEEVPVAVLAEEKVVKEEEAGTAKV